MTIESKTLNNQAQCAIPSVRRSDFIDIALIKMDRYPMNQTTLNLIDYMRGGGEIPPIKVARLQKGGFVIKDGRHRVLACKMLGITKIEARFSDKPMTHYA